MSSGAWAQVTAVPQNPGAAAQSQPVQDQTASGQPVESASDEQTPDIVVTGIRRSIESALQNKRNSNQIVDAITAEDAGKLPDPTVADVLQRVPGVQVAKTFGEGGLVVIRGLQSNRTEVDGHASFGWVIDSSNGFNEQIGRNFGFSSLSANLISKVEVYKTPMASQVEGGLGGVINSITYRASDFRKPTFLLSARGSIGTKNDRIGSEITGFATTRIGERLGVFVGGVYSNEPFYLTGPSRGSWNETATVIDQNGDGKRDIRPTALRSENFVKVDRKRFGLHGNLQYDLTDTLMLRADTTYTNFATNRYIDIGQFTVPANAQIINPVFDGNYVVAGQVDAGFDAISNPRFETIRTRTSSVGAEWKTESAELTAEYANTTGNFIQTNINFGSNLASPTRISFDTRLEYPAVTVANPSVLTNFASYGVAGAAVGIFGKTRVDTREDSIRIDGALLFPDAALRALRLGFRYSYLEQERNAFTKQFGAVNATSVGAIPNIGPAAQYNGLISTHQDIYRVVDHFNYPGFPNAFILPDRGRVAAGDPRLFTEKALIKNPANFYNTKEKSYAGYVQADFQSEGIRGNVGVRVVYTQQNPSAFLFTVANGALTQAPVTYKKSYTDILPSANITIDVQPDLLLRFSGSRTMARQALDQNGLAPNLIVSINPSTPALSTAQSGNPFLDPTRATNFDTSLEWYFSRSGFLAATAFYKVVTGFPVRTTETTIVPGLESLGPISYARPVNTDSGTIKGIEGSYQHTFDFLPGLFSGLGVIASIAYVDGKSDVSYPSGATITRLRNAPLTGVSPLSYSLTGFYEKQGFNIRMSYNWRDDRLFALQAQANGPNGTFDATNTGIRRQYVKAAGSLDASVSYDMNENINIFLNASNLLPKQAAPTYYTENEKFVWRRDIGEARYSIGFRAKF